jgi:hypothetical protein
MYAVDPQPSRSDVEGHAPGEKKNQFVGPERVSFSIQWSAALAVAAACGGEEKWEQRREFGS